MHGVRLGRGEVRLEAVRVVGRVGALRQRHDPDLEALGQGELHPAQRRLLAGRVRVEAEEQALRQPRQLPQLPLRQRRPHRGHDGLEPRLPQGDHVRVPLDDDRAILLRDRGPGEVEPVEDVGLAEELALRRVHVLPAERIVLAQLPRLEADHAAARVGEREHQPAAEVVGAAACRESRRGELGRRVPALARLRHDPARLRARGRAGTRGRRARRAPATRGTHAPPHRAATPTGSARRTRPPAPAACGDGRGAGARRRPPATPPRTRAARRSGRRATRSRRRSRGPRAPGRSGSRRRRRRSRSSGRCRGPARPRRTACARRGTGRAPCSGRRPCAAACAPRRA